MKILIFFKYTFFKIFIDIYKNYIYNKGVRRVHNFSNPVSVGFVIFIAIKNIINHNLLGYGKWPLMFNRYYKWMLAY